MPTYWATPEGHPTRASPLDALGDALSCSPPDENSWRPLLGASTADLVAYDGAGC